MTDREAYNHGYNGTLSMEELLEALPPFFEEHPEVPACDYDLAARFAP